jgi:phosphatidylglycerophosphatase A
MIKKIAVLMATGFGLGQSPLMPGTMGTLLGLPLVWLTNSRLGIPGQITVAVLLSILAVPICDIAEKHFGQKDDHRIVADEYLTFPVCMIGLPLLPWVMATAFVTNRICDIIKPPPARRLQEIKGGAGIVIDDFLSSLYSLVASLVANHFIFWLVRFYLGR